MIPHEQLLLRNTDHDIYSQRSKECSILINKSTIGENKRISFKLKFISDKIFKNIRHIPEFTQVEGRGSDNRPVYNLSITNLNDCQSVDFRLYMDGKILTIERYNISYGKLRIPSIEYIFQQTEKGSVFTIATDLHNCSVICNDDRFNFFDKIHHILLRTTGKRHYFSNVPSLMVDKTLLKKREESHQFEQAIIYINKTTIGEKIKQKMSFELKHLNRNVQNECVRRSTSTQIGAANKTEVIWDINISHPKFSNLDLDKIEHHQKVRFRLYTGGEVSTSQEHIISKVFPIQEHNAFYANISDPLTKYSIEMKEQQSVLNREVGLHTWSVIFNENGFNFFHKIIGIAVTNPLPYCYISKVTLLEYSGLFNFYSKAVEANITHRTNVSNENILNIIYAKPDKIEL